MVLPQNSPDYTPTMHSFRSSSSLNPFVSPSLASTSLTVSLRKGCRLYNPRRSSSQSWERNVAWRFPWRGWDYGRRLGRTLEPSTLTASCMKMTSRYSPTGKSLWRSWNVSGFYGYSWGLNFGRKSTIPKDFFTEMEFYLQDENQNIELGLWFVKIFFSDFKIIH